MNHTNKTRLQTMSEHSPAITGFKQAGFSLIELMLSIALGSILILGAAYAFQEAQRTYQVNDSVARLQEQAQYVLDVLEEDIQMANFWGLHNRRNAVIMDSSIGTTTITGDCASDWALDFSLGVNGTDDVNPTDVSAGMPNPWAASCVTSTAYEPDTDTLVLRHANTVIIPDADLEAGQVYISSLETPLSVVFTGTSEPAGISSTAKTYKLRAGGYYVRNYSFTDADGTALDDVPMLRRMTLVDGGSSPAVEDREIAIGVEDFQVEFGIDTSSYAATTRGSINRYVSPDNDLINPDATNFNAEANILSVRVWLLMRSQNGELNFNNTSTYKYAGKSKTVNDSFRRLLVNRTFHIRNTER